MGVSTVLIDKLPMEHGSFMPIVFGSSHGALLQKKGLKKYDKEAVYHCHTKKYERVLISP